jgi:hypothetical protein
MKTLTMFIAMISVLAFSTVFSQQTQPGNQQEQRIHVEVPFEHTSTERIEQTLDEEEKARRFTHRQPAPPQVVPDAWRADYDYQSDFNEYLGESFRQAQEAGKDVYVYLYADWLKGCMNFRESLTGEDYSMLFQDHEIIMLDYNFFRQKFGMRLRSLPMFLKVNDNNKFGPETFLPQVRADEHPRRPYYRLKNFLEGDASVDDAG